MKKMKNIFPFYHTISDQRLAYIDNLYPLKSIDQFQRELDYLQKTYENISMKNLIKLKNDHQTIPQCGYFHLSFDDGLKECLTIISPILEERNLDATFFINPSFIGNKEIFYRYKVALLLEHVSDKTLKEELLSYSIHDTNLINELLLEYKINLSDFDIYLTEVDVQDLLNKGFSVGAHSMNHPYYRDITLVEQLNETKESLDFIQKTFDLDYQIFSFPFTDDGVSKSFFNNIEVDLSFGTAGIKDDEFVTNIHRLPMDNCLGDPTRFIEINRLKYFTQKIFNKHIVKHE